jgi:hypothetical protein
MQIAAEICLIEFMKSKFFGADKNRRNAVEALLKEKPRKIPGLTCTMRKLCR